MVQLPLNSIEGLNFDALSLSETEFLTQTHVRQTPACLVCSADDSISENVSSVYMSIAIIFYHSPFLAATLQIASVRQLKDI